MNPGKYPNSALLFNNVENKKADKQPDYTGTGEVTCIHCGAVSFVSLGGWIKTSAKAAKKYLSLKFTLSKEPPQQRRSF